jgi:hypothetical protein
LWRRNTRLLLRSPDAGDRGLYSELRQ